MWIHPFFCFRTLISLVIKFLMTRLQTRGAKRQTKSICLCPGERSGPDLVSAQTTILSFAKRTGWSNPPPPHTHTHTHTSLSAPSYPSRKGKLFVLSKPKKGIFSAQDCRERYQQVSRLLFSCSSFILCFTPFSACYLCIAFYYSCCLLHICIAWPQIFSDGPGGAETGRLFYQR